VRTSSRNFAVLLFEEVELWDVASVMHVASCAGRHWNWRPFRLLPVAAEAGLVGTRSQLRLEATAALRDCPPPEILLVPGGFGARLAARDPAYAEFCRSAWQSAELVLTIGAGAYILGAAGVLDGAEVAAAQHTQEELSHSLPGCRFNSVEPIVSACGGKLLSARDGSHGIELGLRTVERFLGRRSRTQLEGNLGVVAAPERLELPDPGKITIPPR
jgi:transcriptional regulator GlxA family with amidase domain